MKKFYFVLLVLREVGEREGGERDPASILLQTVRAFKLDRSCSEGGREYSKEERRRQWARVFKGRKAGIVLDRIEARRTPGGEGLLFAMGRSALWPQIHAQTQSAIRPPFTQS